MPGILNTLPNTRSWTSKLIRLTHKSPVVCVASSAAIRHFVWRGDNLRIHLVERRTHNAGDQSAKRSLPLTPAATSVPRVAHAGVSRQLSRRTAEAETRKPDKAARPRRRYLPLRAPGFSQPNNPTQQLNNPTARQPNNPTINSPPAQHADPRKASSDASPRKGDRIKPRHIK